MTNIGFDEFQHQQSHAFHFRCVGNLPWKFKALQVLTKIYVELKYIIYHTGKGGIAAWIEDDFCDDINNKEECDYDGGDCCGLSVQNNFCVDCKCKCEWNTSKTRADFISKFIIALVEIREYKKCKKLYDNIHGIL